MCLHSKYFVFGVTVVILCFTKISGFDLVEVTPTKISVFEGNSVKFSCTTDSHWEYCTFKLKDKSCNFEWKRRHMNVTIGSCHKSIRNRIEFVGDYLKHACKVKLKNVTLEDDGDWYCKMEQYVFGPIAGRSRIGKVKVDVKTNERGFNAEGFNTEKLRKALIGNGLIFMLFTISIVI